MTIWTGNRLVRQLEVKADTMRGLQGLQFQPLEATSSRVVVHEMAETEKIRVVLFNKRPEYRHRHLPQVLGPAMRKNLCISLYYLAKPMIVHHG